MNIILGKRLFTRFKFHYQIFINFCFCKKYTYKSNEKHLFVIDVPNFSNLGDHAIGMSQYEFLKSYFKEYNIIEVEVTEFTKFYPFLKKNIKKDDVVLFNAGGNIGVEYFIVELHRRKIINKFKNNKLVIMPQTIDFGTTSFGKKQLKKSSKIYSKNENLIICAREKFSYDLFKDNFSNKVYLIPDIVLFLNKRRNYSRNGSMMLMRNDVEKKLSLQETDSLKNILIHSFKTVDESDTVIENNIGISERKKVLENFWDNISKYQLIVTDRLHGMIFAYITGTPCIVFSNYNHKVKGIYETWLSKVNNIQFCNDINEFKKCLSQIDFTQEMDQIDFSTEFDLLCKIIKN